MQEAIKTFINSMQPGDYAAIVKFNATLGASVVKEFTQVDGAANTAALIDAVIRCLSGLRIQRLRRHRVVYPALGRTAHHFAERPQGNRLDQRRR